MRKLQSAMIALFCTGVFAAGLGTGMTFSEFSSFAYMGNADAGPVDMKTDILEYDMSQDLISDQDDDTNQDDGANQNAGANQDNEPSPRENTSLNIFRTNHLPESEEDIVADTTVPHGIIRFQVTYNAAAVKPYVEFSRGEYVTVGSYNVADDFELFMRYKDLFLKDLKARQLHSYGPAGITQIKVLVHPDDRDLLRLR